MPECFFASLPDAGPCDGRLVRCHLIPKNKLRDEFRYGAVAVWSRRPPAPIAPPQPWLRAAVRAEEVHVSTRELAGVPLRELQDDPRCWVWGCGGPMGPGGHHGQFKPDGPRPIPRHRLPPALEEFAAELGLEWWVDYTYGPRWDDDEAAAREAHGDVPLP